MDLPPPQTPSPPPAQPAPPPAPAPVYVPPPPRASGCGCFAMGCMSFLGIGFLALTVMIGCAWYAYVRVVDVFTAAEPAEIAITQPAEADYTAAEAKLNTMRNAIRGERAATIAFTSAELNALIARDPEFAGHKGRTRIDIADSMATIELSVPLRKLQLPRLKHRWFNGSTRLAFTYDENGFDFDPQWIEANGRQITGTILGTIVSSVSSVLTTELEESIDRESGVRFWKNIKSMKLEGNQLIIVTRGPSGGTSI